MGYQTPTIVSEESPLCYHKEEDVQVFLRDEPEIQSSYFILLPPVGQPWSFQLIPSISHHTVTTFAIVLFNFIHLRFSNFPWWNRWKSTPILGGWIWHNTSYWFFSYTCICLLTGRKSPLSKICALAWPYSWLNSAKTWRLEVFQPLDYTSLYQWHNLSISSRRNQFVYMRAWTMFTNVLSIYLVLWASLTRSYTCELLSFTHKFEMLLTKLLRQYREAYNHD